jgi:hypothetical protein
VGDVVGVHARDQRAACALEAEVQRGHQASALAVEQLQPRIARCPRAHTRGPAVGRAVVDRQHLALSVVLGEQAR